MSDEQKAPISPKVRLLPDLPADHDAFGPHGRVARAIADLIREEKGGKAIALTGSWGSGKSTVVRLLESKFGDGEQVKVFVFDAWSHQGDPLRRSFLEELVEFLRRVDWLTENKKWEQILEEIKGSSTVTESDSQPRLYPRGKVMAVLLYLFPIGLVLLAGYNTFKQIEIRGIALPWIGIVLILLPLLWAALCFFIGCLRWLGAWLWYKICESDKKPSRLKGVVSLFINKIHKTETTTSRTLPDQTSIEFRGHFSEALDEALASGRCGGKGRGRRLVVVIDNLDRIQPDQALSIWSTMRTFFVPPQAERPAWMNRFWLIVPYDPSALQRLCPEENKRIEDDSKADGQPARARPAAGDENSLAAAFAGKTFQISFEVPPTVLPKWKNFFGQQFRQAFLADELHEDCNVIFRLYQLSRLGLLIRREPGARHFRDSSPRPTPRDIKRFLNQVGAVYRQWPDGISFPVQALFVLVRQQIFTDEESLAAGNLLEDRVGRLLGIDNKTLYEQLAALYLNVEPELAMEVLLRPRIHKAFASGEAEAIKALTANAAFEDVCVQVLAESGHEWRNTEPWTIALPAIALHEIASTQNHPLDEVWHRLVYHASAVPEWKKLDGRVAEGIEILLDRAGSELNHLAKNVVRALRTLTWDKEENQKEVLMERAAHWTRGALIILRAIKNADLGDMLEEEFGVPGDEPFYLEVVAQVAEMPEAKELSHYFKPGRAAPESVINTLKARCNEGKFSSRDAATVRAMVGIEENWTWEELVTGLEARLNTPKLETEEITGCIETLLVLRHGKPNTNADATLRNLTTQSFIAHHLFLAQQASDTNAEALCTLLLLEFKPNGNVPNQGHAAQGVAHYQQVLSEPGAHPDVVKGVAGRTMEFRRLEGFLPWDVPVPTGNFVGAVIEYILPLDPSYVRECIPNEKLIQHYERLTKVITEKGLDTLIGELTKKGKLLHHLQQETFQPGHADIYRRAYHAARGRRQKQFGNHLSNKVRGLPPERFLKALDAEDPLTSLMQFLLSEGFTIGLPVSLSQPLRTRIHDHVIQQGAGVTDTFRRGFNVTAQALTPEAKKDFFPGICNDLIMEVRQPGFGQALSLCGSSLADSGTLEKRADDVVRVLFTAALERREESPLVWVVHTLENRLEVWNNCDESHKTNFRERVSNALDQGNLAPEVKGHIKHIAELIKIRPDQNG